MTRTQIYRTALELTQRPPRPQPATQTAPRPDVLAGLRAYTNQPPHGGAIVDMEA